MKPLIPPFDLVSFGSLSTALPEFSACSRPEEVAPVSFFSWHSGGEVGGEGGQTPATRRGKGFGE